MTLAALILAATFARSLERVATMDPAFAQSVYDNHAVQLVYETPLQVDYGARPYRVVPGAFELPEVSSNGLVYVFRERADHAEPLAEDAVRSLLRLRSKDVVSPNGWMMKRVESVRALDARTFEVRLRSRQHVFPWLMTMGGASIVRADGSGTGPYELTSWRKNHEMTFTRRKGSAVPLPPDGFDTVRYLVIDDVTTQWLMFLRGEIDYLGEVSRDNWDAVIGSDGTLDPALAARGVTLHSIPTLDSIYIGVNMKDPVLGPNRRLRQALNAAFDFPAWNRFFSGRILESGGPVPVGVDGALDPATFPYRFDLDKARRLMREAGYPDGTDPKTGRRLVLTLAIGRASQDSRESAELLASFWERIGVRLECRYYTWDAFMRAVNEGRTQLFRIGWVGDYPDAENFLQLFHSANVAPGPNRACYSNPEYDREFDAAMAAATAAERNVRWARCQEIVREDCPWIFTHFTKANTLVHRRVGNYVPSVFPYGQEKFLTCQESEVGK